MDQYEEVERRLTELEARVAGLESQKAPNRTPRPVSVDKKDAVGIIQISVTNKRYQPEDPDRNLYQDHIWFDCAFSAVGLARPARAIKGTIEFCDLFGESKFQIGYTLNDRLGPGDSVSLPDIGFEYNQFLSDHQWMLSTDLENMTIRFRVDQILYEDGTSETVAYN